MGIVPNRLQDHEDHGVSGAAIETPGLTRALAAAQSGDVLVVWKLDRLGRSLPHLVEVINGLREAGVGFRSLQEPVGNDLWYWLALMVVPYRLL